MKFLFILLFLVYIQIYNSKGSRFSLKKIFKSTSSSNALTSNSSHLNTLPKRKLPSEEEKIKIRKMLAEQKRTMAEKSEGIQQPLNLKRKSSATIVKNYVWHVNPV